MERRRLNSRNGREKDEHISLFSKKGMKFISFVTGKEWFSSLFSKSGTKFSSPREEISCFFFLPKERTCFSSFKKCNSLSLDLIKGSNSFHSRNGGDDMLPFFLDYLFFQQVLFILQNIKQVIFIS